MRKRRRRRKTSSGTKQAAVSYRSKTQPVPPAKPQSRRLWRYAGGKAFWFINAMIGLVSGMMSIWGPIWPTEPAFSPGEPSFGQPLDIPFSVTNTSALFNIGNLKIGCVLIDVRISDQSGANAYIEGTTVSVDAISSLTPRETRSYTCPFQTTLYPHLRPFGVSSEHKVIYARIVFDSQYDRIYGLLEATARSDIFTLDTKTIPPQWTHGAPMY